MEIELKMERIWKFCNISRLPIEESTVPQGAGAHTFGTTAVPYIDTYIRLVCIDSEFQIL